MNMKYLKSFFQLNESQSKKIKEVLTFSVVLEWYKNNKEKIAKILGCDSEDLISEKDLIEQSTELVKSVINTQYRGNTGIDNNNIAGFSKFKHLEKYLLHDILHNMYDVSKKDFDKSLSRIEFTESEIFEEIEILCIEESFMKFVNIPYPKTDFINQNINQLASYLMMTILKNDPNRIKDILDGKVKPYLEIYDTKYEINEGSPLEDFFLTLRGNFRDMPKISNSDDFKKYMIKLINVGIGIDQSSGDRSSYPDGNYYGTKDFSEADDSEISEIIENFKKFKKDYIIISSDDIYDVEDLNKKGIVLKTKYKKNKDYSKLEQLELPFKKEFLEKDGFIDLKKWLKFLSEKSEKDFYEFKEDTYLVIYKYNDHYSVMTGSEFVDDMIDYWDRNDYSQYDNDHDFINFDNYNDLSFEEVSEKLFYYDNSISIMRRNFRDNDVIVNNTKLGNVYKSYWSSSWEQKEINLNNGKSFTDFTSDRTNKVSLSKNIITNNAKRLMIILNNIKGYAIKNYNELKNKVRIGNKFTENDIKNFINLDIDVIKFIKNGDVYLPSYKVSIILSDNKLCVNPDYNTSNNLKLLTNIDAIISFFKKIETKDDINYLKSYVLNHKDTLKYFNRNQYSLDSFRGILEILEDNKEEINNLIKFNNKITENINLTKEEGDELSNYLNKMKYFSPSNEFTQKLYSIIEKYYNDYDPIISLPEYYYGRNINDILIEIRKIPN